MKILASILTFLVIFSPKTEAIGGGMGGGLSGNIPDVGSDISGDISGDVSGDISGGMSGGLSGNMELPANILEECGVGANVDASAGGSASGDLEASTDGGVSGSGNGEVNANVNAEINLPSCDCIRKFDAEGSAGGEGSAGAGGVGVGGGASVSGSVSLAMPGVNCVESEGEEEEEEEEEEEDSFDGYVYIVDIERNIILSPANDFVESIPVSNMDSPAEFKKTIDMDNPLKFYRAEISVDNTDIYNSRPEKKMTNVCDDSYPEGSVEANIWHVFNLEVLEGKGCPVEQGTTNYFYQWLNGTELKFNEPLPCGKHTLHMDIDTPEGDWALGLYFDYTIENGDTECTEEKNQLK